MFRFVLLFSILVLTTTSCGFIQVVTDPTTEQQTPPPKSSETSPAGQTNKVKMKPTAGTKDRSSTAKPTQTKSGKPGAGKSGKKKPKVIDKASGGGN